MKSSTLPDVSALLARQRPGFTLEQPFYTSQEIYRLDLDNVLGRQWQLVDHVSQIPNPGDYMLYELADESIIIVRGEDDEIHAHFNVCRHRGSRVCLEARGHLKRLVCPYHAWAYGLDGKLVNARQMPDDFDPSRYGLHPCRVETFEGLIFVNLIEEGAGDFSIVAEHLAPYLTPHRLANAKVVHREVYPTYANWKLAVENFRECYHCTPAHPEYADVNAYVRANDKVMGGYDATIAAWGEKVRARGHKAGWERWDYDPQPHHAWRQPIREGFRSLTKDGSPAAPLMGDLDEYDGGESGAFIGACSYLYVADDHATTFRFTPMSPTFTEVVLTWLVRADASERDYDVDHLKWMWDVTTIQDTRIINDNQKGVSSKRYLPGPYSKRESATASFTAWYLAKLREALGAASQD